MDERAVTEEAITKCPQCGLPVDGVPEGADVRCRSCAVLLRPARPGTPPEAPKKRASGYVIAVLVSTVICMLLILGLVVVTGVMLLRGG